MRATSASLAKSIPERIDAIVIVLERLASDIEIIRIGLEALKDSLPQKYDMQRRMLHEQASAFERISIGLGMVQHTAASLAETRSPAEAILHEVEALGLIKDALDKVLASYGNPEDWQPILLGKAICRFNQCLEQIREATVSLTGKTNVRDHADMELP